jgi:teichoic acid transport system ATP-binding protein
VWLHEGSIIDDGPASDVARRYRWWAWCVAQGEHAKADDVLRERAAAWTPIRLRITRDDSRGSDPAVRKDGR